MKKNRKDSDSKLLLSENKNKKEGLSNFIKNFNSKAWDFNPSAHTVIHKLNRAALTADASAFFRYWFVNPHIKSALSHLGIFKTKHLFSIVFKIALAFRHPSRRCTLDYLAFLHS